MSVHTLGTKKLHTQKKKKFSGKPSYCQIRYYALHLPFYVYHLPFQYEAYYASVLLDTIVGLNFLKTCSKSYKVKKTKTITSATWIINVLFLNNSVPVCYLIIA